MRTNKAASLHTPVAHISFFQLYFRKRGVDEYMSAYANTLSMKGKRVLTMDVTLPNESLSGVTSLYQTGNVYLFSNEERHATLVRKAKKENSTHMFFILTEFQPAGVFIPTHAHPLQ